MWCLTEQQLVDNEDPREKQKSNDDLILWVIAIMESNIYFLSNAYSLQS